MVKPVREVAACDGCSFQIPVSDAALGGLLPDELGSSRFKTGEISA